MPNLKQYLKKELTKNELDKVKNAFDIVGDIAVLEIPRELRSKNKIIAAAVMDLHRNVKSVYLEKGGRAGKYRLQKLQWLAGEKRTTTSATENGVRLKLDIAKVYFSPRQASERKRIYEQVRENEEVLVMFSGVCPYAIEIAKHGNVKRVIGVEANRAAHVYAIENAAMNKVEAKVQLYCGDVKKVVPELKEKFNRIIMPLPKGAHNYLSLALKFIKKNGVVHYYDFLPQEQIPQGAVDRVTAAAKNSKKKIKIRGVVKCGQLAPRAYRVCVDFKIS